MTDRPLELTTYVFGFWIGAARCTGTIAAYDEDRAQANLASQCFKGYGVWPSGLQLTPVADVPADRRAWSRAGLVVARTRAVAAMRR